MFDRKVIKARAWSLADGAQISARKMTALLVGIVLLLTLADTAVNGSTVQSMQEGNFLALFLSVLVFLVSLVLQGGYTLYCMAVRRGERVELLTLFDGFSLVGKLIGVFFLQLFFVTLWTMLFLIPGIIAAYRYSFATCNILEHPEISPMEAIRMSKAQTNGCKGALFMLDISFIGWNILSTFSYTIVNGMTVAGYAMPSALLLSLVCGLLSALVDLWRLPYYFLSQLAYFDIAKESSGVGAAPRGNDLPPADRKQDEDLPLF